MTTTTQIGQDGAVRAAAQAYDAETGRSWWSDYGQGRLTWTVDVSPSTYYLVSVYYRSGGPYVPPVTPNSELPSSMALVKAYRVDKTTGTVTAFDSAGAAYTAYDPSEGEAEGSSSVLGYVAVAVLALVAVFIYWRT